MRIRLTAVLPDLSDIAERLERAAIRAIHQTAERMPERITGHLKAGRRPDGSAQPSNRDSTLEAKRRKGQGATPGVADGVLSDPARWRVTKTETGAEVEVPIERRDVVEILEARDYLFVGVPEESERDLERLLERELGRVR